MLTRNFISILFVLSLFAIKTSAQKFSYVYIQGDKQTPFYVKMEGEMLPRYSKNYCIISRLEAGTIHIQVLFQQNLYPAHDFYIQVPEAGSREFMLTKKGSVFSLYDLQQGSYLAAGKENEDQLPQKKTQMAVAKNSKGNLLEDEVETEPIQAEAPPLKKKRTRFP